MPIVQAGFPCLKGQTDHPELRLGKTGEPIRLSPLGLVTVQSIAMVSFVFSLLDLKLNVAHRYLRTIHSVV
jgi:hypothetical protein